MVGGESAVVDVRSSGPWMRRRRRIVALTSTDQIVPVLLLRLQMMMMMLMMKPSRTMTMDLTQMGYDIVAAGFGRRMATMHWYSSSCAAAASYSF